jgi:hypothetical protein
MYQPEDPVILLRGRIHRERPKDVLERRLQRLEPGWEKVDHIGHDEDEH